MSWWDSLFPAKRVLDQAAGAPPPPTTPVVQAPPAGIDIAGMAQQQANQARPKPGLPVAPPVVTAPKKDKPKGQ